MWEILKPGQWINNLVHPRDWIGIFGCNGLDIYIVNIEAGTISEAHYHWSSLMTCIRSTLLISVFSSFHAFGPAWYCAEVITWMSGDVSSRRRSKILIGTKRSVPLCSSSVGHSKYVLSVFVMQLIHTIVLSPFALGGCRLMISTLSWQFIWISPIFLSYNGRLSLGQSAFQKFFHILVKTDYWNFLLCNFYTMTRNINFPFLQTGDWQALLLEGQWSPVWGERSLWKSVPATSSMCRGSLVDMSKRLPLWAKRSYIGGCQPFWTS